MSEVSAKKRPVLSRWVKIALALVIIAAVVVLTLLYAPHERDSSNVTGDSLPVTVTVTNLEGTLIVNRSVDFQNVKMTVTNVMQAGAFSDDSKHTGAYTVRVQLVARDEQGQQDAVGIDFSSLARLQLADGQSVSPKLVAMSPVILPNQTVNGYIDFPVATQVSLSALTLRLGSATTLPFS